MLSLIGAIFIFAASSALGLSASAMLRLRAAQLEAFTKLIAHTGAQINSFLSPLDRIFHGYENRLLEGCGFLECLRSQGGKKALELCRTRLFITDAELLELESFFGGLGKSVASEAQVHCEYYEKRIGELATKAKEELAPKARLCRSFGMLVGIMLAVILL